MSVGLDGTDVTVSAEVENIGETWPAAEAVQVYISRPDAAGAQPVWLLDCFARTKLLAPGERETVQLRFPVTELAAYRESACAFALEEGYYDVRVGFHSVGHMSRFAPLDAARHGTGRHAAPPGCPGE